MSKVKSSRRFLGLMMEAEKKRVGQKYIKNYDTDTEQLQED